MLPFVYCLIGKIEIHDSVLAGGASVEKSARPQEPLLDERDAGKIVLTHVYLLAGCALPSFLCPYPNGGGGGNAGGSGAIVPYAGVLILGVGDTVASVVGTFVGKMLWVPSEGRGKTVEGTVAGWVATAASAMLLMHAQGHLPFPSPPVFSSLSRQQCSSHRLGVLSAVDPRFARLRCLFFSRLGCVARSGKPVTV